jgi:integrase/recombinase XerD
MRNTKKTKDPVKVSLYLDTRRKKDNGNYPVRIRVYDTSTKKARLYTTDFDLTEKDFNRIFYPEQGQKIRKEEKEFFATVKNYFYGNPEKIEEEPGLYNKFKSEVSKIKSNFSFDIFESNLFKKEGDLINVFWHYESLIEELKASNRFGTAISYGNSLNSLKSFLKEKNNKEPKLLNFQDVTVKFLEKYEVWMTETKGKSLTTVGIYSRALRVIFNKALEEKIIDRDIYPFGPKRYEIPASSKTKKAFDSDQLEKLFQAVPRIEEQQKAKDFWFFSLECNGMNIKDIVYLKWKNINDGQIEFVREKTKRTKKAKQKTIQVPLDNFLNSIIEKYSNSDRSKNSYVFPIINESMSEEEKDQKKRSFIRFVNQHLKNLAKDNGLNEDVSTYWARHSFATMAVRNDVPLKFISDSLGHSNFKTTENYIDSFPKEVTKEYRNKMFKYRK